MDRRNLISSYLPSSRNGGVGRDMGPGGARSGHAHMNGAGRRSMDPAEGEYNAVANHYRYRNDYPSNPRNSPPRAGRGDGAGASDHPLALLPPGHRSDPPPPRLTYHGEGMGAAANVRGGGGGGGGDASDLVESRPVSARGTGVNRGSSRKARRERPADLVVTPGREEDLYDHRNTADVVAEEIVVGTDKAYSSSVGRPMSSGSSRLALGSPNGRRGESSPVRVSASRAGPPPAPSQFLVRVHRVVGAFSDLEEAGKARPTSYIAVHTTEERGRTGVVADTYNPTFNDEFLFTSSRPEKDAVVLRLVAAAPQTTHPSRGQSMARDRRVAEAMVSLQNLEPGVEKEQWVTLVRHPGTADAYERGEVLVSIVSESYGQSRVPTEEEEGVYDEEIHDMLVRYAPEELHRLNWLVGSVAKEGPEALARLRARLIEGAQEPVQVCITIEEVAGLTAADGAPATAASCYVALSTRPGSEVRTKTAPYRRRAAFHQSFMATVRNPAVDGVALAVYSAGHKLGETLVGLANVEAAVPKRVTLMIVHAAETGDAAPVGEVTLTLKTEGYSSPHVVSAACEARRRERVLAFLWHYLRDDLHRLDCIVAGIDDDEDAYMAEWSRTIGPERPPRHASLRIRRATNVLDGAGAAHFYVRVMVGPHVYCTERAMVRGGGLSFASPMDLTLYDVGRDSITCILVEEADGVEREVSRVVLGLAGLPIGESTVRTVHLVAEAGTRDARLQGELELELAAHDFGVPPAKAIPAGRVLALCERLEAAMRRSDPESLHRVPYTVDTAPADRVEEMVEQHTRESAGDVTTAPMTVRVLGLRDFRWGGDCYVKAYLNGAPILTTLDKSGGAVVRFDIEDDNEVTVKLTDAVSAVLSFKIGQHRTLRRTTVIARTELALRSMTRGERNTVWIPFFEGSAERHSQDPASAGASNGKGACRGLLGKADDQAPFTGNRLPLANAAFGSGGRGGASSAPLGYLGVMLQSMAFPATTVTEYVVPGSGERSGDGGGISAYEAVTRDVTSLLAKFRPQELAKVQPLIAACSSVREAHRELRARLCPHPVGATVYVQVEQVELATEGGRVQEEECGVMAEVCYGEERQWSRKRREFDHDALNRRIRYELVRLDIADPRGEYTDGPGARGRRSALVTAPPLVLRLVGVRGGGGDRSREGSASRGAARALMAVPNTKESGSDAGGEGGVSPRRSSLGGANNLVNYVHGGGVVARQAPVAASGAGGTMVVDRSQSSIMMSRRSLGHMGGGAAGALQEGEIGFVQLSLRAFLSAPLHSLGTAVRVPIISRTPPDGNHSSSRSRSRSPRRAAESACRVVGHVTLRLTMPAFEVVPEWLRLGGRGLLSEVDPRFIHYYARRIGAYLRQHHPADLTDLHYRLYERDVASGRWPIALPRWMQALVKRFGPEMTNTFGPEPVLPFNPDELEGEWERSSEQARLRAAAFAPSETTSQGAGADGLSEPGVWIGDVDGYLPRSAGAGGAGGAHNGNGSRAADIYEVRSASEGSRRGRASAKPRDAAAPSSHSRSRRRTARKAAPKAGEGEPVYGF